MLTTSFVLLKICFQRKCRLSCWLSGNCDAKRPVCNGKTTRTHVLSWRLVYINNDTLHVRSVVVIVNKGIHGEIFGPAIRSSQIRTHKCWDVMWSKLDVISYFAMLPNFSPNLLVKWRVLASRTQNLHHFTFTPPLNYPHCLVSESYVKHCNTTPSYWIVKNEIWKKITAVVSYPFQRDTWQFTA